MQDLTRGPIRGHYATAFTADAETARLAVAYIVLSGVGVEAQAGFGVGLRVMQSIFLPAMAVSFALAPIRKYS